jgi:uncharacterized protein (DUF362 family)/ubiquinone/menaquinone biosynthesis C-methylase UbiE
MNCVVINYDADKPHDDVDALETKLEKLFQALEYVPPRNGKIFFKPNLCGRDPKLRSENISGAFLEALIRIFSKYNCKILIGHTSLLGTIEIDYPFEKLAAAENYDKVAARYSNVELVNLDKVPQKKIQKDKILFEIPALLDEVDQYINITKLKTHAQTTASLSLKNAMGTCSMANRKIMHYLDVHHYIAELATIIKPHLNIIDGVLAMEGQGPHHGEDIRQNIILAGYDMVELDSLACTTMGIDYRQVEYIVKSQEKGVGQFASPVLLKKYEGLKRSFKLATSCTEKIKNLRIWPTTACTGCTAALVEIGLKIDQMKGEMQDFKVPPIDFFTGTGQGIDFTNVGKIYGIGDCTKEFCQSHNIEYLPGCPMSIKQVEQFLFERVEANTLNQVKLMFKGLRMALSGKILGGKMITQGYNNISQYYEDLWGRHTKKFNDEMLAQLDLKAGLNVLDVACGTGANTVFIAEQVKTGKVMGVDMSEGMLNEAKKLAESRKLTNINFIQEDMLKGIMKPNVTDENFDRIICFWAIGYSQPVKVLKEMKRAIKKGGKMAIIANMADAPKNAYNVFMELAAEFPEALAFTVKHNFPKSLDHYKEMFRDAGFNLDRIQFKKDQFEVKVNDGKAALDWLLQTGAGALYDDAIKPEWKDRIHELFAQRIQRYMNGNGIPVVHEFVSAVVDC